MRKYLFNLVFVISAILVLSVLMISSIPVLSQNSEDSDTHAVEMTAESLEPKFYGYKITSYNLNWQYQDDLTEQRYGSSPTPSIPGPTIVMNEGDRVEMLLNNGIGSGCVGMHVHGVDYTNTADGTPMEINGLEDQCALATGVYGFRIYWWDAPKGSAGTWPYHDHTFLSAVGSEEKGLFGAFIVNKQSVEAWTGSDIIDLQTDEIDKEFVIFLTDSPAPRSMWVTEIDNNNGGLQTPLGENPILVAKQNDYVRFHILSIGSSVETFHLHYHKWIQPGTTNLINSWDIGPAEKHVFTIKAGGLGDFEYHSHIYQNEGDYVKDIFRVTQDGGPSIPGTLP